MKIHYKHCPIEKHDGQLIRNMCVQQKCKDDLKLYCYDCLQEIHEQKQQLHNFSNLSTLMEQWYQKMKSFFNKQSQLKEKYKEKEVSIERFFKEQHQKLEKIKAKISNDINPDQILNNLNPIFKNITQFDSYCSLDSSLITSKQLEEIYQMINWNEQQLFKFENEKQNQIFQNIDNKLQNLSIQLAQHLQNEQQDDNSQQQVSSLEQLNEFKNLHQSIDQLQSSILELKQEQSLIPEQIKSQSQILQNDQDKQRVYQPIIEQMQLMIKQIGNEYQSISKEIILPSISSTMSSQFTPITSQVQQLISQQSQLIQSINSKISSVQPTLFTAYTINMISWSNTSHTPSQSQALTFIGQQSSSVIAWDGRQTGSITFDFQQNYQMIQTSIRAGTGLWRIEFSDDNSNYFQCASIYISRGQKKVHWDNVGGHRYWRYNLEKNDGSPYYYGYDWYY